MPSVYPPGCGGSAGGGSVSAGTVLVGSSVSADAASAARVVSAAAVLAAGSAIGEGVVTAAGRGGSGWETTPGCPVTPIVGGSPAGALGSFSFDRSTVGSLNVVP